MSCMAAEEKSYCSYSDVASSSGGGNQTIHLSQLQQQHQSFAPNPEIYSLTAGMEMIGFPSKNLHLHQHHHHHQSDQSSSVLWKGFFNTIPAGNPHHHHGVTVAATDGPSSSSKEINGPTSSTDHFYQRDLSKHHDAPANEALMMQVSQDSSAGWSNQQQQHHNRSLLVTDDSSLRCVFPCEEENERPSQSQGQGLSLSLNSSNPSPLGLQAFDLRQQHDDLRFVPSSSRSVNLPHHSSQVIQEHSLIRNSTYLGPAQELLNEVVCNIGTKQSADHNKVQKASECSQDENVIKKQSLYSLDFLELQIRKTKLLQMLEEVDRRYRHYCDQMKAVVSSFESVTGDGAASVYSASASKAMSRHFRCLKDGIVSQIKATKKAMGEKDAAAGAAHGTMRGETPRLRLIDQTLRQQRALQQMSMMESHPWRPQRGLPERSVSILRAWLFEHFLHPYPSDVDKHILARQTGLSRSQVSNWFINARVRLWKPMVEEMYLEELKERDPAAAMEAAGASDSSTALTEKDNILNRDEKPSHDQLVRIDSDCLSSIVTNPDYSIKDSTARKDKSVVIQLDEHQRHFQNPNFARMGDHSIGTGMELDFSSYNHRATAAASGGGGVSLTLGLHQHGPSGGLSLGFSATAASLNNHNNNVSGLFYPRGDHHMEDCQTVQQYSLLDSESQNLPYRNLMGAQLLHDLAG